MEMTEMRVNPLPSVTWHWTGMNDSRLEIALPDMAPEFVFDGNTKNLYWTDDASRLFGETDGSFDGDTEMRTALKWSGWDDMETGMGDGFAGILRNTGTAFLRIPEGYNEDEPAVISVVGREGAGRIFINAGTNSSATVIIRIGAEENANEPDTVALQLMLRAEEDAHIRVFVIQSVSDQGLCCLNIGGVCEKKAEIELTDLSLGAEKAYIGIAMSLEGEKSAFQGDMGYHVKPGRSVDINYVTRHIGRDSVSTMDAWGVLEDGSSKLFRGTIDFKEGCAGSKGAEKEDVLLRGEHQINKTVPLILCHEEDVEGDHGATISRVDDEILFYLETRGLDAGTAENMIAKSRLEALINKIPDEDIRRMTETAAFPKEKDPSGFGYGDREGDDQG